MGDGQDSYQRVSTEVDWELESLLFNNKYPNRSHAHQSYKVPTNRTVLVPPHEAIMDIFLANDIVHVGVTSFQV